MVIAKYPLSKSKTKDEREKKNFININITTIIAAFESLYSSMIVTIVSILN